MPTNGAHNVKQAWLQNGITEAVVAPHTYTHAYKVYMYANAQSIGRADFSCFHFCILSALWFSFEVIGINRRDEKPREKYHWIYLL